MPLFICEKCGCIENTALGRYWSRNMNIWADDNRGKALCSECAPTHFKGGEVNERGGKWHGRFEKTKATKADRKSGRFIDPGND